MWTISAGMHTGVLSMNILPLPKHGRQPGKKVTCIYGTLIKLCFCLCLFEMYLIFMQYKGIRKHSTRMSRYIKLLRYNKGPKIVLVGNLIIAPILHKVLRLEFCNYFLLWGLKYVNSTYFGLSGAPGTCGRTLKP